MRKKQLTMQQGLALGCLILVVCAVVFGIVLRATRAHDLEDPEKVAAAICDLPVDYQEERNTAAEMLDISVAVEQLQDRIPLQVEITGMQPTYNNLRYTAKVLKTTDREQAGNTVVLYLLMSMEKMSDGKLHCDTGIALPLAVGHKYLLFVRPMEYIWTCTNAPYPAENTRPPPTPRTPRCTAFAWIAHKPAHCQPRR